MKKDRTLAELLEGKNEFEKFVFFHNKNEERLELMNKCHMLIKYSDMNMVTIAKAIRVSWKRLMSYYLGRHPMPYGFMITFGNRLEKQLLESQREKDKVKLDWYFNAIGISADMHSSDGATETSEISSPSTSAA